MATPAAGETEARRVSAGTERRRARRPGTTPARLRRLHARAGHPPHWREVRDIARLPAAHCEGRGEGHAVTQPSPYRPPHEAARAVSRGRQGWRPLDQVQVVTKA